MQAVCYKCSSVIVAATHSRCPSCQFPLIAEACTLDDVAPPIDAILHRQSVSVGAPRLPGVDVGPGKAMLLMEARKARIERRRTAERRAQTAREDRRGRARAVAFASFAAGIIAAAGWLGGAF
jgi:hypothetical protein